MRSEFNKPLIFLLFRCFESVSVPQKYHIQHTKLDSRNVCILCARLVSMPMTLSHSRLWFFFSAFPSLVLPINIFIYLFFMSKRPSNELIRPAAHSTERTSSNNLENDDFFLLSFGFGCVCVLNIIFQLKNLTEILKIIF